MSFYSNDHQWQLILAVWNGDKWKLFIELSERGENKHIQHIKRVIMMMLSTIQLNSPLFSMMTSGKAAFQLSPFLSSSIIINKNEWGLLSSIIFIHFIAASSKCVFPQQWEGSWFQSGVPKTIDIQGSTISNRGTCIASENDKFLMIEWVNFCDQILINLNSNKFFYLP
jgi:hypothetical protein